LPAAKHSLPNEKSVATKTRKLSHEDSIGERPAAIILQIFLTLPEGRQGRRRKYLKRCLRSRKVTGVVALFGSSHRSTKSQLFFFLSVLTMDPTYFPSNHKPDTESFILSSCKFLSSSHLWLNWRSLVASLDSAAGWWKDWIWDDRGVFCKVAGRDEGIFE